MYCDLDLTGIMRSMKVGTTFWSTRLIGRLYVCFNYMCKFNAPNYNRQSVLSDMVDDQKFTSVVWLQQTKINKTTLPS